MVWKTGKETTKLKICRKCSTRSNLDSPSDTFFSLSSRLAMVCSLFFTLKVEKQTVADPKFFLDYLKSQPKFLKAAQSLLDPSQETAILKFFPTRQNKHLSLSALLFYFKAVMADSKSHRNHHLRYGWPCCDA